MGRMGSSFRPKASTKIDTGGGGLGSLTSMMMAQSMLGQKQKTLAEADIAKEDELAGSIASTAEGIKSQFGGNVPRGSKITRGGTTIDLNPRPNAAEIGDIASQSILEPHFKNLTRLIDEGTVGRNPIERTIRGLQVDSGQPILAGNDERLKQLQSELNILKSKLPFDAGGKQLTGVEKELVFKLLNITGKDDATIKYQLNFAMDMIRKRAELSMGGLNAVNIPMSEKDATAPSDEPMANPIPKSSVASGERIKVVRLDNGKRGTISAHLFDPKKYARA